MKIKFKDLYKLITDGELLQIAADNHVYYEDGEVYSVRQEDRLIDKREKNENFDDVCKRYFDYYVTKLFSGLDGGICVVLEELKDVH